MPRQLLLFCVAVAVVELAQAAETNGIGFDAIDDPLAEEQLFLPIDQAFAFTFRLHVGDGGAEEIVARWDMPEGYYLYRHGFAVEADHGLTLGELTIPPGEMRTDEYFGESVVYFGGVEVVAPVLNRIAESATVRFSYQGCAERGFCYPPTVRAVTFQFGQVPPVPGRWRGVILVGAAVLLLAVLLTVRAMRSRRAVR